MFQGIGAIIGSSFTSATISNITTLDPSKTGSNFTLSNGNLTATSNTGLGSSMSLGTVSHSTGKKYFEVTVNIPYLYGSMGIATASANYASDTSGNGPYDYSFGLDGYVYYNTSYDVYGPSPGNTPTPYFSGVVIGVCADFDNHELSFSFNGTNSGVHTLMQGIAVDNWFPMVGTYDGTPSGNIFTINFGATAFANLPAGYSAWNS